MSNHMVEVCPKRGGYSIYIYVYMPPGCHHAMYTTHTKIHVCTYIYIYIHTPMHVCIYVHIHIHISISISISISIYMYQKDTGIV